MFYDLNVHVQPETTVGIKELSEVAKGYGYDAICAANHSDFGYKIEKVPNVIQGVEIVAKNVSELKRKIAILRTEVEILVVHGGDGEINRAAAKDSRVDILAHPWEIDHITARFAAENNVALDFSMDTIIYARGARRSRAFHAMRAGMALMRKYGTPFVITSNSTSIYGLRSPKEMVALAMLVGMEREEAESGLSSVPEGIVRRRLGKRP